MWTKGVLLLGLIACWTAVCNAGDGDAYDYGIGNEFSKELAEDYLFRADDTCSKDEECKDTQKCEVKGEGKACQCADGLSGDNCEKNDWCAENGKFKNCKSVNGTCEYSKEKRAVVCTCSDPKRFHPDENRCKETCAADSDCGNGGKCEEKGGEKFCSCNKGFIGDKCQIVFDCSTTGKYKGCESSGGKCKHDGNKAVCECSGNKKLHDTENVCKECDCSPNEICKFENGEKKCTCKEGFALHNGKCTETCNEGECKYGSECKAFDNLKFCECAKGLSGDKCDKVIDCEAKGKFENCTAERGTCEYDKNKKEAVCTCKDGKKLNPKVNYCQATCSKDEECKDTQKCVEKDEWKACQCADGLGGDDCEKNEWCAENGKFKNCKNENGTCEYNKEKRAVVCTCSDPKRKFHPDENRCRETCAADSDCENEAKCNEKGGDKFCSCTKGLIGDKCQTVFDCSSTGKYKGCQTSGGECKYDGSNAVCECSGNKKLHDKENVCRECDCGPKGECKFENGVKNCTCEGGYALHKEKCTEICDDDCQYDSECKAFGELKFCVCKEGLSGDMCEKVIDCGPKRKFENCTSERGTCEYDKEKKEAVCRCEDEKKFNLKVNYCQETCNGNDDCNGGKCEERNENKFCKCKPELMGDKCEIAKDCVDGKYSKCKESGGKCGFDGTKSICKCPDDKLLDEIRDENKRTKHICRTKCSTKDDCKNGAECKGALCRCPEGTEGDDCGKVIACETLNCEKKNAVCTYDSSKVVKTFCVCIDPNYEFNEKEDKCVAKWCEDGCNKDSICEYENGVGICKCKNEGTYYDYASKLCKTMDSCFNKKCEGELICNKGSCECPENYKKKNATTCEPKDFCTLHKCFTGALCEKGSSLGYVKCLCNSASKFYLPRQSKCDDGVCFLPVERKNCSKPCPKDMKRQEGICKFPQEDRNCGQDCGFLGWCENFNDTAHRCHCDPTYAEMDKNTNKCVLKASAVCPTKEKIGDSKCKCTGKYKQAANGVTCELKSCSDEDVQNECKKKRAPKCEENWKSDVGYKCVCPDGYIDDAVKGCIDPCTWNKAKECLANGQMCYIGQKLNEGDCRCPPTFIFDEKRKSCDLGGINTYMIHSLPVLKKKYETVDNDFNKVLLTIDVSTSMKQAFNNLDFAHILSFKMDEDVVLCDVWLQFQANLPAKFNATSEVRRWRYQLRKSNGEQVLLPGLFLSSGYTDSVKEEELTICTDSVQQSVCGTGSTCVNNTCSCQDGFREIDSTIKASGNKRIVRCEDVNECTEAKHNCAGNSECVNTLGDYLCKCKPGFKKAKGDANAVDKEACIGLCEVNPCGKGTCQLTKENTVDCSCPVGYTGSFCNKADVNLAKASKATKVVGAVLGTLLGIVIILIIVYIVRQRKNSYSEDFTPAPRNDNAEMVERRPMRGVTNRAFQ